MTRTQDIESVRAACVRSNPDISTRRMVYRLPDPDKGEDMFLGSIMVDNVEDSIQLSDCILALKKQQPGPRGYERLHICSDGLSHELQAVIWMWDPTETLEYQENGTLRALAALLGNE